MPRNPVTALSAPLLFETRRLAAPGWLLALRSKTLDFRHSASVRSQSFLLYNPAATQSQSQEKKSKTRGETRNHPRPRAITAPFPGFPPHPSSCLHQKNKTKIKSKIKIKGKVNT